MLGKVALVTGGGRGIGAATVRRFADAGAAVCIADVVDSGAVLASSLLAEGRQAMFVRTDVSADADVQKMVAATVREFGGLHFAFNCAGITGPRQSIGGMSEAAWAKIIGTNLTGAWLSMRAELPAVVSSGGGVIVNCASMGGLYGGSAEQLGAYAASKAGVIAMSKVAAREYGPSGVRILSVCPGATDTDLLRQNSTDGAAIADLAASKPLRRVAQPIDIANVVVWLCSDGASYITGHPIPIDGAAFA